MRVTNVMASSLDGLIGSSSIEGDVERRDTGLSSESDLSHLLELMRSSDAIIVGASSIRSNKECLSSGARHEPDWFIYCQNAIPENYPFWAQRDIKRTLVSQETITSFSPEVKTLTYADKPPADYLYYHLKSEGYERVLLFGGGYINQWFYQSSLVDRLVLTLAPLMMAQKDAPKLIQPALPSPQKFSLESVRQEGDYLFLNYLVKS